MQSRRNIIKGEKMENRTNILARFAEQMKKCRVRLHGAVLMSGEKVIEEIYNAPYNADTLTRMYSTSKSVAAVAIGKLIKENKLSLDDRITDIFADRFDMAEVDERLKEQTIRDMLCMTTCYSLPTYTASTKNWLESYFKAVPTHYCGTVWHYDSCGSYVLGAVTKHITGKDFVEYLRPEFDIMGVSKGVYCMQGPDGEAWASSAFMASTSDLARIACLLLNKGRWNGMQLIPEDYARDAISPLVRNDDAGQYSRFDCGYGYQVWGHPDGAFAFRGLGGQVAIGFPGRDLVFSCNSDTACNKTTYEDIFNAVEDIILPEFPIIDRDEYDRAQRKPVESNVFESIKGNTYRLRSNSMHIDSIRFTSDGDLIRMHYTRNGTEKCIEFATGRETRIIFPEKYTGTPLFDKDHYINYECAVSAEWIEPEKLAVHVWAEDTYVGNMMMCFGFRKDGRISVKMRRFAQFFFDDFNGIACGEVAEQ